MTASEQARADALADAETLRQTAEFLLTTLSLWGTPQVLSAMSHAQRSPYWYGRVAAAGRDAARAAFRAVPGLRGDR